MTLADISFGGAKVKILQPKEVLFEEGSVADEMFYVESGTLDIFKEVDGKRVKLGRVSDGEFLGERAILGEELPRTASATARTECEVVVIGKKACKKYYDELPPFLQKVMTSMAIRLQKTNEMV